MSEVQPVGFVCIAAALILPLYKQMCTIKGCNPHYLPQTVYRASTMVAKATLKHFTVAERFSQGDAARSRSINNNYRFLTMDFTRRRLRRLNDQIFEFIEESCPEEDLEKSWKVMQSLYYDLYMLRAIREAKEAVQPGDTMLYEEALRVYRSL